ncbi:hypothetical protein SAMN05216298_3094 [Glycomyces sambucus]|uniref:Uncharacterized protein n=1 Tax=Glycomyces sambucus TaxID=380244 RepID=A0A1G9I8U2_9ACTN|nr:hypothetical protein SAMN05216298_3094 [Glycomyces sambucus]
MGPFRTTLNRRTGRRERRIRPDGAGASALGRLLAP